MNFDFDDYPDWVYAYVEPELEPVRESPNMFVECRSRGH